MEDAHCPIVHCVVELKNPIGLPIDPNPMTHRVFCMAEANIIGSKVVGAGTADSCHGQGNKVHDICD